MVPIEAPAEQGQELKRHKPGGRKSISQGPKRHKPVVENAQTRGRKGTSQGRPKRQRSVAEKKKREDPRGWKRMTACKRITSAAKPSMTSFRRAYVSVRCGAAPVPRSPQGRCSPLGSSGQGPCPPREKKKGNFFFSKYPISLKISSQVLFPMLSTNILSIICRFEKVVF